MKFLSGVVNMDPREGIEKILESHESAINVRGHWICQSMECWIHMKVAMIVMMKVTLDIGR